MTVSLRRTPALDGLRAAAALSVLAFHLDATRFSGGFLGIDVFFVLSGYLITRLLLDELATTGRFAPRSFFLRRAARLVPALVLCVLLATTCGLALGKDARHLGLSGLWALSYTSDLVTLWGGSLGLLGHTWSLAIEEQFYLLWPFALVALHRRGRVVAPTAAVAAACVVVTAFVHAAAGDDAYFLPVTHACELLVGCLLAHGLAHEHPSRRAATVGTLAASALALCVVVVPGPSYARLYQGGWLAVALLSALVVRGLSVEQGHPLARALAGRLPVWLGQRSYGLYLYSAPLATALKSLDQRFLVTAALTVVTSTAAAALSYRYVEAPLLARARTGSRAASSTTTPTIGCA